MRGLLELEWACRPVPAWARQVARQIANLPPCGWCLLQAVEAICTNIGAGDEDAAHPHGCHRVGPHQIQLMSDYAVCLAGWLRGANPEMVAAGTSEKSLGWRDWERIAKRVALALGEPTPAKGLLVRRLMAHLRRPVPADWPAPKGPQAAGEPCPSEGTADCRQAWQQLPDGKRDPALAELDAQIRRDVPNAEGWLNLIDAAWPCAPRPFHYLERIVAAFGQVGQEDQLNPAELARKAPGQPLLHSQGAGRGPQQSGRLFDATVRALQDFVVALPAPVRRAEAGEEKAWAANLADALGRASPVKTWLAAVLLKRVRMSEDGFKSLRLMPNTQQVT